jgi:hypothetical protein
MSSQEQHPKLRAPVRNVKALQQIDKHRFKREPWVCGSLYGGCAHVV